MGFKLKKVIKAAVSPAAAVTKAVKNNWVQFRDALETAAVVVGNYYLPGSSMVTSRLTSKGSQKQLNSQLGIIAQMSSGIAGANNNKMDNWGKLLKGGASVAKGEMSASEFFNSFSNTPPTNGITSVGSGAEKLNAANTGGTTAGSTTNTVQQTVNSGVNPDSSIADRLGVTKPMQTPAPPGGTPEPGLINKMTTWAGNNPVPALMAGNMALSGVGGMMQASGDEKKAEMQREMDMRRLDAQQSKGGWGAETTAVTINDPTQIVDVQGRYVYGPNKGQYARPGLINMNRSA